MISVIIISKNRQHLLSHLLKSLEEQTFNNFEVIIIDNYSNEKTADYVKNITSDKFNVKKIFLPEEMTISYCRNESFRGKYLDDNSKYVMFIDDDDCISRDTLSWFYKKAVSTNAEIVISNFISVFSKDSSCQELISKMSFAEIFFKLLRNFWMYTMGHLLFYKHFRSLMIHLRYSVMHSILTKREVFDNYTFDNSIIYGEDNHFRFNVFTTAKKIKYYPLFFVPYRKHGTNTQNDIYFQDKVHMLNSLDFLDRNNYSNVLKYLFLYKRKLKLRSKTSLSPQEESFLSAVNLIRKEINFFGKVRVNVYMLPSILKNYLKIND
ncbi:glycosyltransferase [Flavobacterium soyae]|uniref:glycosyltransferase n=1 Tax=Flavobacterium soyae TaxID=2903098 RepID=UPI001E554666|nr:glycosyltransferase [Flavobacterium soyae]MCD9574039.1 glycosyltransferase [Flavobacterium soyae]